MNATFAEVTALVSNLRPGDRYQLWVQLSEEFDPGYEDEKEIEAAWDKELEQRVKDVQEGRVELLDGDAFLAHVRAAAAEDRCAAAGV
jgi:hypothetical protein